ncbi:hypothetical protein GR160_12875 [Flavobacterium sp. Sd200]|uniref:hypothetical protein n=1 Tax=Flavobacterium sp. Sd200 TaxID=2692211 RepID=UPI00136A5AB5|nr:hypothetical protein [Flavobacterium sp. Sd200]MXN92120.1 hypothetical protein [Flavobacterium sp. Sd200]
MKRALLRSLCLILLLSGLKASCQDTTVFITKDEEPEKQKGSGFFEEFGKFSMFTLSLPLRVNPEHGQNDNNSGNSNWFLPDGLSAHGGFGTHVAESFIFSTNTGIDWHIATKLVSVPVYGSIVLTPSLSDKTSLLLQAGLGYTFAIGRGDVSGLYQKYRIGLTSENAAGIFAEVNFYGYAWKDAPQMGSINLGICLLIFD